MTAPNQYLSSIFRSFSTFADQQPVNEATRLSAEAALAEFLEQQTSNTDSKTNRDTHWSNFSDTDFQQLERFLEDSSVSDQARKLLHQFVREFPPHQANVFLHQYLIALQEDGCSESTIRNYRSDIRQFVNFSKETELTQIYTKPKLAKFTKAQLEKGLKESTVKRKLSSISQFGLWAAQEGILETEKAYGWLNQVEVAEFLDSHDKNVIRTSQTRSIAPQPIPTTTSSSRDRFLPGDAATQATSEPQVSAQENQEQRFRLKKHLRLLSQSVRSRVQHVLPDQTRRWLLPYLNLALIVLFFAGLGYFGYRQLFTDAPSPLAYPSSPTRPARVLSYQGRLTDQGQNPITTDTQMRFYLYDADTGGNQLWDSATCTITPDQDGIFTVSLGDDCGAEIGESVFTENSNIWLEAEVETETLTPRQPIRTVAYALNAETVQGYPIDATGSATANTLLTMNDVGDVVLGEVSPKIKSVSGEFSLEGESLLLQTTAGSDGDIVLDPDGVGGVISRAYLEAPGATLSATYAGGVPLTVKGGPSGTGNLTEWQASDGTVKTVVDESGSIGIGTTPSFKLDVAGDINLTGELNVSGAPGSAGQVLTSGGDGAPVAWTALSNLSVGNADTLDNLDSLQFLRSDTSDNYTSGTLTFDSGTTLSLASGSILNANVGSTVDINGNLSIADTDIALDGASTNLTATGNFSVNTDDLFINKANGYVGIGITNPQAQLHVTNGTGIKIQSANAQLVFADSQKLYQLVMDGSGNLQFKDNAGYPLVQFNNTGSVGIGTTNPSSFRLQVAGDVGPNTDSTYNLGSSSLAWNNIYGSNIYGDTLYQNGNQVCDISGTCANNGLWMLSNGAYIQKNTTADVLIGGIASNSAKFAFLNVNSNTPTASISGSTAGNALSLTGDGVIDTSNNRSLSLNPNGGNVGIGTTSPAQALTVNGNILIPNPGIGPNRYLEIGVNGGNELAYTRYKMGESKYWDIGAIQGANTYNFGIGENGTNKLTIENNSGSVGIGDTSPATHLVVGSDAGISIANQTGNLYIQNDLEIDGTTTFGNIAYSWPSAIPQNNYILQAQTDGSLSWVDPAGAAASAIFWELTGEQLHPKNALNHDVLVGGTSTSSAKIALQAASGNAYFDGKVGIGTTSPISDIHIQGQDSNYHPKIILRNDLSESLIFSIAGSAWGETNSINRAAYILSSHSRGLRLSAYHANGDIRLYTGGGDSINERLRISSTGNVGIGTTSPTSKLHVSGATTGKALAIFDETGDQDILTASASGAPRFRVATDGYVYSQRYADLANASYFLDPAASDVAMAVNGKVGIGTTTPARTLDVQGNAYVSDTLSVGIDATTFPLYARQTTALGSTSGDYKNLVKFDGNTGASYIANTLFMYRDSSGSDWTTTRLHDAVTIDGSFGVPGTNTKTFWERDPSNNIQSWGNAADTYMTINAGNVGIGTTAPAFDLDIAGDINFTGELNVASDPGSAGEVLTSNGSGSAPAWASVSSLSVGNADTLDNLDSTQFLRSDTSDNYTSGTLTFDSGTTLSLASGSILNANVGSTVDINGNLSIADTDIALDGASTNLTATGNFSVNTDDLFINKANGRVGIGTTSPAERLSVVGGNISIDPNYYLKTGGSGGGIKVWGTQNSSYGWDGFVGRGISFDGTNYKYQSTNGSSYWGTNAGMWIKGAGNNAIQFIARPATEEGLNITANDLDAYSRLTIQYDGNLGIGTTTPSSFRLQVAGDVGPDADATYDLGSSSLAWNNIYGSNIYADAIYQNGQQVCDASGNCESAGRWELTGEQLHPKNALFHDVLVGGTSTASAKIALQAATGDAYFNGNVGIGTTNPSTNLHIDGGSNAQIVLDGDPGLGDGNGIISLYGRYSATDQQTKVSLDSGGSNPYLTVSGGGNDFIFRDQRPNKGFLFWNSNNDPILSIDSVGSGRVGVRDSSPDYSLEIDGSQGNGYFGISNSADGDIMSVTSTGNVGIGTTSPTSKLHVSGATTGKALAIFDETGDQDILTASASGAPRFRVATDGYVYSQRYADLANASYFLDPAASDVAMAVNGKVGIGTTTPTAKLDVGGDVNITGYATASASLALGTSSAEAGSGNLSMSGNLHLAGKFYDGASSAGSAGYVLTSTGSSTAWSALSTMSVGNADTLDNLDSLQFLRSDTSDNYTSGTLTFDSGTTLSLASGSILNANVGSTVDVNGDLTIADTDIALDGASTNLTATGNFSVNTDDLFINKANGYVGIGTTSPSYPLDVSGEIRTTDDLQLTGGSGTGIKYYSSSITFGSNGDIRVLPFGNGNVGIGTTTPSSFKLQVAGDVGPNTDSTYNLGSSSLAWNNIYGSNIYGDTLYQNGNQVCDISGTCANNGLWMLSNGAYIQKNTTADVLIGGIASNSAKFAFLNVNSNTPTASISGSTAGNALSLTGDGVISTSNNRSLSLNPNGGNVGIGTTEPLTPLHIKSGSTEIFQVDTDGTSTVIKGYRNTDNYETILKLNAGYQFPTNSGNFLFGNATSKFSGQGGNISLRTSSPDITMIDNAASGKGFNIKLSSGDLIFESHENYNQQNQLDRITFTNSGSVGIGDTSPATHLVVGSDVGISIANQTGNLYIQNDLEIDGTTTFGNIAYSWPSAIPQNNYILQAQTDGSLSWVDPAGAAASAIFWELTGEQLHPKNALNHDVLVGGTSTASAKIALQAASGNAYFDGKVGIGTTSPGAKLEVAGAIRASNDGGFQGYSSAGNHIFSLTRQIMNGENANLSISALHGIGFSVNSSAPSSSPAMYIARLNGNVGIGTTSPTSKLHVSGATTGKALAIFDETGDQDILTASASGAPRFRVATDGYVYSQRYADLANASYFLDPAASDVAMAVNGKVGIGTTSPSYKLDVAGTGRFTGAVDLDSDLELNSTLTDINNEVGTAGQILSSTATGVDWIDATLLDNYVDSVTFSTTTGDLTVGRTGSLADIVTNLDGRYLTSYTETDPIWVAAEPNYFNLSQNEIVTGIPAFNGGVTGTSAPFTVDSTFLVTNLNADLLDGYHANNLPYMPATTDDWVNETGDTMTGSLNFSGVASDITTAANEHLALMPAGTGNVGIGTTTPSSFKLQVAGDIGPNTDSTYNLGSSSLAWSNIYADTIYQNGSQVCDAGGNCGTFYWDLTNEQLHPKNALWHDILVGGTSTSSATIALQANSGDVSLNSGDLIINGDNQHITLGASGDFDLYHDGTNSFLANNTGDFNLSSNAGFVMQLDADGNATESFIVKNSSGNNVVEISETKFTSNVPAEFLASGDVAMAYDLNFTNQTASYINSNAPLYIQAGESWESNDLTLRTYNAGNVIVDSQALDVTGAATISGSLAIKDEFLANGDAGGAGEVLTSNGSGTAPTWQPVSNISVGNADTLDNLDSTEFLRSNADDTFEAGNTLTIAGSLIGNGNLDLNGNLSISDTDIALDGASANLSSTGDFSINTDDLFINKTSGAVGIGTSTPGSYQLNVNGTGYVGGALSLGTQATSTSHAVRADRSLTAGSGLTGGGDLTANRTFNVGAGTGITVNADDVAVNQAYNFAWTGTQTWSNTATFNGSLIANGAMTANGALTANGDVDLGDAITDSITFTGRVDSSILPITDNLYDLGSSSLAWANIYGTNVYADAIYQNGQQVCDASGNCGTYYWNLTGEQLHPANALWHDILVGGTSTSSATIALQANTGNAYFDGQVGIGTTTPGSYKLNVNGSGYFGSDLTINGSNDLYFGSVGLSDVGSSNITAGASKVGVYYPELGYSTSTNVQDVLDDLDNAINTLSGGGYTGWTARDTDDDGVTLANSEILKFAEGAGIDVNFTTTASSPYTMTVTNTAPWTDNSNSYIQNQNAVNQAANFKINGTGYVGGALSLGTQATSTSHAVRADRNLTAGNGLSGGGNLTADRTFDIGAGNGITVNADDVAVNQAYNFAWTGTQTWSNTATFNGSLIANGAMTANGALTANGDVDLGDAITDSITFTGRVDSSILPITDNLYDLGSSSLAWANIYGTNVYADAIYQNGQQVCDASGNCGSGLPSGTSGQTIRHNGTDWVADSNLYNNGTDIGIGTTSPAAKLHILSNSGEQLRLAFDTTTYHGMLVDSTGLLLWSPSDNGAVALQGDAGGRALLQVDQQGDGDIFTASASGQTKFVIDNAGQVGIGTTAPQALLDIAGVSSTISNTSGDITLDAASDSIAFSGDSLINILNISASGQIKPGSYTVNPTAVGDGSIIYRSDLNQLYYYDGTAWSSVGANSIWTNNNNAIHPADSLASIADLLVGGDSTASASFRVSGSTGYTYAPRFVDKANSSYYLDPAATGTSLAVNGSVGIGVTSPSTPLDVYGAIQIRNNGTENSFASSSYSRFYNTSGGGSYPFNTNGNLVIQPRTDLSRDINFATYDGSSIDTRMTITSSGVGIGLSSPTEALDVNGDVHISGTGGTIGGADIANAFLLIGSDGAGLGLDSNEIFSEGANLNIGVVGDNKINFQVNSQIKMAVDSTGVGIGLSSPTEALDVNGDVHISGTGGTIGLSNIGNAFILAGNATTGLGIDPNEIFTNGNQFHIGTTDSNPLNFYINSTKVGYFDAGGLTINNSTNAMQYFKRNDSTRWRLMAYQSNDYFYVQDADQSNGVFLAQNSNSWASASDIRLKSNITEEQSLLERISQLRTVTYNFKDNTNRELGVIAQELLPVFPELVSYDGEYYGVAYDRLGAIAMGGIKEQYGLYKNLNTTVNNISASQNTIAAKLDNVFFSDAGQLTITPDLNQLDSYKVTDQNNKQYNQLSAFSQVVVGKLKAGSVQAQKITADSLSIASNSFTIAGQSIQEFIDARIEQYNSTHRIALSPEATQSAEINHLATNTITPASGSSDLNLQLGPDTISSESGDVEYAQLNISDSTGKRVAQIDSQGNATLLGNLNASDVTADSIKVDQITATSSRMEQLEAKMAELEAVRAQTAEFVNATISGTLYATEIEGLDEQLAESLNQPSLLDKLLSRKDEASESASIASIFSLVERSGYATESAGLEPTTLTDLSASSNLVRTDVALSASAAYIDSYISVNGSGYIGQHLGVGGNLMVEQHITIGNSLAIGNNYIDYQPLETSDPDSQIFRIQPSGIGTLDLMAGLLTMSEDGNVLIDGNLAVSGNIEVGGTLLTSLVQPQQFSDPLQIQLATASSELEGQVAGVATGSSIIQESRLEVTNQDGDPTATISARGRGSFSSLNIDSEDLTAVSTQSATIVSNKSSGRATLRQGTVSITIRNIGITDRSLIYISPIGSTHNQILYVKTQVPEDPQTLQQEGQFTVGFDQPITKDAPFNWWIVN